jgi:hypothetical protein
VAHGFESHELELLFERWHYLFKPGSPSSECALYISDHSIYTPSYSMSCDDAPCASRALGKFVATAVVTSHESQVSRALFRSLFCQNRQQGLQN